MLDVADRVALADLVARYASCADRRDLTGLVGLFTEDSTLVLPDPPAELGPVNTHRGRDAIGRAMSTLEQIPLTSHALAGEVFDAGDGRDTAAGRIACAAHHLSERPGGEKVDLIWHLHYVDAYRRQDGIWRISRRAVVIDWIETARVRAWRQPAE